MSVAEAIVQTDKLTKRYAGGILAVDQVSFEVPAGTIFGFLGPNGAGKTTTIMMLTTLIKPTSGRAVVCGRDVVASPDLVRLDLGYVSQDVAVDENLTGWENLYLQARLYHLPAETLRPRIEELLKTVELDEHARRLVSTYSGGMRKRLDIAAGLIHRPRLLFLDEPTLGLDIQTRTRIWEYIRRLRDEHGLTVFLTTHYMEEADNLCDLVAIMDHGRIVALDSPAGLKARLGGDVITLEMGAPGPRDGLAESMRSLPMVKSAEQGSNGIVRLVTHDGDRAIPSVLEFLGSKGIRVSSVTLKRPSLDDVFLHFTGRQLRENDGGADYRRMAMAVRRARR
ncbi:MAG: ATP-binding cassette domain-containing protein [Firmicutes bacterium]|jgi:ABC-2 type transport system ATP-binding protein|nr:ATP-binding cassette domain-containing protein [Bacillota bacterium]